MKILHCADIHLDSKLGGYEKTLAKTRNAELLNTYICMVDYAKENDVEAILIAGDLFDTGRVSASVRNTVYNTFVNNPEISFYYLRGNHDNSSFLAAQENIPENLFLFNEEWHTYYRGKVAITGLELTDLNSGSAYISLMLNSERFNIVMLHGQESETGARDKAEVIQLRALRNKGIDYLALGHIHSFKLDKLDARANYCYPGCLEGRGFDECGEHGFVVLDIDEQTGHYTTEFVPFARRRLYEVSVDVTDCMTTFEMDKAVSETLLEGKYEPESFLKIILCGTVDVECEKNPEFLLAKYKELYGFAKICDETDLKISIDDYALDQSLKGEFVRQVMADDGLKDEEKTRIIRYGLQAIAGEEIQ